MGNCMFDASELLPSGWHPWMRWLTYPDDPTTLGQKLPLRLARPQDRVKYYFLDFGLSIHFRTR